MRSLQKFLAILAAKLTLFIAQTFHIGAGGTWPGELAQKIYPDIATDLLNQLPWIVLVAGTNGKTTTTKMLCTILNHNQEKNIITNETGANLLNGIISTCVQHTTFSGIIKTDGAIFEVDEAVLPLVLVKKEPDLIILQNLFRDQLDRYGEVDLIAEKWQKALTKLKKTTVLINADDPHLAYIGKSLAHVHYFGIGNAQKFLREIPHAVDTLYCPSCGKRLQFSGVYLSHLGEWECTACWLKHPANDISSDEIKSPLLGTYNIYNSMAAVLATHILEKLSFSQANTGLQSFKAAFGRQEEIFINGKKVVIFLSKNPAGFNASLQTVLAVKPQYLLIILNDRIPDGRDVSWIWDVDFEMIKPATTCYVSGDRTYDMAVRLKYALKNKQQQLHVIPDLQTAVWQAIDALPEKQTLYILPTYSAMLDTRRILTGKKIL